MIDRLPYVRGARVLICTRARLDSGSPDVEPERIAVSRRPAEFAAAHALSWVDQRRDLSPSIAADKRPDRTRARASANLSGINAMGCCEEGSRSTWSAATAICSWVATGMAPSCSQMLSIVRC
jgi:hypothetical protein